MDRLQRNNVKVLVVTRLFSGLIRSVVEEKWQPTGIPAMYRFIEGLSRHHIPAVVVFLCKTAMESKDINEPIQKPRWTLLNAVSEVSLAPDLTV